MYNIRRKPVEAEISISELEVQLFKLQTRMIQVGMLKGLTHPDTVKCRQELDVVINNVQRLKLKFQ